MSKTESRPTPFWPLPAASCFCWALYGLSLTPESKFAWAMTIVGGVLAIVGSVWGWQDLNDFVAVGANAPEASIGYGAGLYMALVGGIAGVIVTVGRLGSSELRVRL